MIVPANSSNASSSERSVHVQIVRGFVEQQHVGSNQQRLRQVEAARSPPESVPTSFC